MTDQLYTPLQAGELRLANRFVMAPMARHRASDAGVTVPAQTPASLPHLPSRIARKA